MKRILLSIALCGMMGAAMSANGISHCQTQEKSAMEFASPDIDFSQLMETLKTYKKDAEGISSKADADKYFPKMQDLKKAFLKIEKLLNDDQKESFKIMFNEVVDILKTKK